jgi:hypothetical protein
VKKVVVITVEIITKVKVSSHAFLPLFLKENSRKINYYKVYENPTFLNCYSHCLETQARLHREF